MSLQEPFILSMARFSFCYYLQCMANTRQQWNLYISLVILKFFSIYFTTRGARNIYILFFIPRTLSYKGLLIEFPLYLQLPMCKRRMRLLTINFSAACMAAPVALCTLGFLLNNVGRESSSCNTS